MSSKTQTTTTNAYDPSSMSTYKGFAQNLGGPNGLSSFINNGQLQNAWLQQSNNAIGQIGNRMNSNVNQNLVSGGWGGGNQGAFQQAQLNRNMRTTGNMQGNAYLQSVIQGSQLKLQALGMMSNYQPLQTGGTQTQTKSGLGTWLPQLAGAAIGAGASFLTGGASSAIGASMGGINSLPLASGGQGSVSSFGNSIYNSNPGAYAPPSSSGLGLY